jgi:hypothetical protein
MRFFLAPLALLIASFVPSAAHAEPLQFTLIGDGNTIDFTIGRKPTPGIVDAGQYFGFYPVTATFDGAPDSATIYFTATSSNFYQFQYLSDDAWIYGSMTQIYTGSESDPTLLAGAWTFTDANNGTQYTLNAGPALAPAPEPSALLFLGTGLLGVAGLARRRFIMGFSAAR